MTRRPLSALAVVIAFVAGTNSLAPERAGAAPVRHWLALGDSYSSGEGIPETAQENGRNYRNGECSRASGDGTRATAWAVGAYRQVRSALGFESIDFVACTGALADEADAQIGEAEADSRNATWDLVTFGFGGNDIGFGDVIKGCLDVNGWDWFDLTPGCDISEQQLRARIDMLVGRKAIGAGYPGRTTLPQLYDRVAARVVSGGNVVVVGYPNIVEEVGRWDRWRRSVIGNCEGIQDFDVGMLRSAAGYLNEQIARVVQDADARHRDDGVRFTFEDVSRKVYETGDAPEERHALCARTPWINGQTSGFSSGDLQLERSFHPTQVGHDATANDLAQVVRHDLRFTSPAPNSNATLLSAPVPPLCGYPAGRLVGGKLPASSYSGLGGLVAVSGYESRRLEYAEGDLDGDGRPEIAASVDCLGGDWRKSHLLVWKAGPTLYGEAPAPPIEIDPGRFAEPPIVAVAIRGGVIEVRAEGVHYDSPGCCPGVFASRRYRLAGDGRFAVDATPRLGTVITPSGVGPLHIGMEYGDASFAANVAIKTYDPNVSEGGDPATSACSMLSFPGADLGAIGFVGRVVSIVIGSTRYRTSAGVSVGSSVTDVRAAYPNARFEDNAYTEVDDLYVHSSSTPTSPTLRFQFDPQTLRVRTIHAGQLGAVSLMEGCL